MMTVKQIYDLSIKMGINADPRGKEKIEQIMIRRKKKYESMDKEEKRYYNIEKLNNPYPDSMIFVGEPQKKIKKILAGIDIDTSEMLLADKLGGIDMVIAHHPEWPGVPEVMDFQVDHFIQHGMPANIAERLTQERSLEIERMTKPLNHMRKMDAAKLLNLPLIAPHTPMDILAFDHVNKIIEKNKPEYVEDILKLLLEIPEYQEAKMQGFGPTLFAGNKENRAGKIIVTFAGGTSPSPKIYEKLSQIGVGTLIDMHMTEESRKEAEKFHMNIVIAGHYSSDSLGTNIFLDEIEKKGIEIVPCSGLIRVKRFK